MRVAPAAPPRSTASRCNRSTRSPRRPGSIVPWLNTARDLAAVIRHLGVGKVDLYGDSYGTYFAQSFLSRYPQLLRSVVLDSAYEARDLDPWYRTTVTTARRAFDTACRLSAACHSQAPGKSWNRITALAK